MTAPHSHQAHARQAPRHLDTSRDHAGAPAEMAELLRAVVESNLALYELQCQEAGR